MKKKAVYQIMLALLAMSIVMTMLPVDASMITVLSMQPTSIIDPTLVPGSIFRINITVDDVDYLWLWQFVLWFDPTILNVRPYLPGDPNYGLYPPFEQIISSEINNDVGYIYIATYTHTGGVSAVDPTPIAWIEFIVLDVGTTPLHFDPGFTVLYNVDAYVEVDGLFDNRGPKERTHELIEVIESWNLHKGTENGLTKKLEEIIHLLDKGNENGAIRKLNDFINQVEAMRGKKKLTHEQADQLIASVQEIINAIG